VAALLELGQQLVDKHHLAGRRDEGLEVEVVLAVVVVLPVAVVVL
jgi:hypothetical protein